jgi:hypothetical protein
MRPRRRDNLRIRADKWPARRATPPLAGSDASLLSVHRYLIAQPAITYPRCGKREEKPAGERCRATWTKMALGERPAADRDRMRCARAGG